MKTQTQILAFLNQNRKIFRDDYHIVRIGFFGSYARGDQKITSDIDLLVEFEDNVENLYDLKLQIKEFFQKKLNLEVDICREKYIKPRMKKSILEEVIYAD
jgi:predicted nucleotidyltransferase